MQYTIKMLVIFLMAFSLTGSSCVHAVERTPSASKVLASYSQEDIFQAVNRARVAANEPPLIQNAKLQAAAQKKAEDMAKRGWFSHTSPEGTKVWPTITATGYQYSALGENLARDFSDATSTVAAWIKSPTHYANIKDDDFRDTGIGIAVGTFGTKSTSTYVVQLFGMAR